MRWYQLGSYPVRPGLRVLARGEVLHVVPMGCPSSLYHAWFRDDVFPSLRGRLVAALRDPATVVVAAGIPDAWNVALGEFQVPGASRMHVVAIVRLALCPAPGDVLPVEERAAVQDATWQHFLHMLADQIAVGPWLPEELVAWDVGAGPQW